jgi:N-acetylglucosaminyldiphosphoundecaprenol N-acetyl-beta-D-mannosaminyltransferase
VDRKKDKMSLKTINFLGVGLNAISYPEMIDKVDEWLTDKSRRSFHIACVNAYCISLTLNDKRLKDIYNSADIVGADGMPFVWWIRLINRLNCDRLYAPDTLEVLLKSAKEKKYTFYLYGGAPDVVVKMKENIEKAYPYIQIVGYYSPPFRPLTKEEDMEIVKDINALKPDIIAVGLGTPKQDYWIDEHISKIRGSVIVASGATFDFWGGRVRMAPKFIQKSGFEWLYRLFSKDFMRLWKRYTWYSFLFISHFFLQVLKIRVIPINTLKRPI